MSVHGQVVMANSGVVLYQHDDGKSVYDAVYKALLRRKRWDQEDYLTRIIFSIMIRGRVEEEAGHGIRSWVDSNIKYTIRVDVENQTVILTGGIGMPFKAFVDIVSIGST